MKKKITDIMLLLSSFFFYLFFPKQIFGITNPALTTTNPALPGGGEDFFSNLLSTLITALLIFGVIFFVFVLAFGAIKWITAGGDKGAIQQAKEKVTHGLIGAVILLSLFAIYGTVGCFLGIGPCSEDIGGGVIVLPLPLPTMSPIAECPSDENCVCSDSDEDLDCGDAPYKICSEAGGCSRVECADALCCICSLVPPATPTLDPSLPTPTPVPPPYPIAFASRRDSDEYRVYIMNSDGSNSIRLSDDNAYASYPKLSPDGSKVVFSSDLDRNVYGNYEIYVANTDGSGQTRLTTSDIYVTNSSPTFSPDGSRIAFSSDRDVNDDNREIYIMNSDGGGLTRLTFFGNSSTSVHLPVFSPDGSKIAFMSNHNQSDYEIYVVNSDGSNLTMLTDNSRHETQPSFSPDGRIVFVSRIGDNHEIYIMNSDGSNQINLTNNEALYDVSPVFSPDGSKIAFTSNRDGHWGLYVMDANGDNPTLLNDDDDYIQPRPVFSPDGSYIAYATDIGGDREIFIISINGDGKINLTNNSVQDDSPDW